MGQFEKNSFRSAGCTLAYIAAAMLIVFILSLLFSSCKTRYITQEVPVIVHDKDSVVKIQQIHTHDTLHTRDSVYHYVKGDTTIIERWHKTQVINNINRVDTLVDVRYIEKPVTVTKTVVKEVNHLYWWQTALMCIGGGLVFVGGYKLYRRFKP